VRDQRPKNGATFFIICMSGNHMTQRSLCNFGNRTNKPAPEKARGGRKSGVRVARGGGEREVVEFE
jgi:hypothetical protein